jgi:hypothetical protein
MRQHKSPVPNLSFGPLFSRTFSVNSLSCSLLHFFFVPAETRGAFCQERIRVEELDSRFPPYWTVQELLGRGGHYPRLTFGLKLY